MIFFISIKKHVALMPGQEIAWNGRKMKILSPTFGATNVTSFVGKYAFILAVTASVEQAIWCATCFLIP